MPPGKMIASCSGARNSSGSTGRIERCTINSLSCLSNIENIEPKVMISWESSNIAPILFDQLLLMLLLMSCTRVLGIPVALPVPYSVVQSIAILVYQT